MFANRRTPWLSRPPFRAFVKLQRELEEERRKRMRAEQQKT